jgi:hypothetical protein
VAGRFSCPFHRLSSTRRGHSKIFDEETVTPVARGTQP